MTRLCFAVACLAVSGCADLTAPSASSRSQGGNATAAAKQAAQPPAAPAADPNARLNKVRASHVLVAYQGSARSQATRSKDEAKQLAEGLLNRLRGGGAKFEDVAKQHSDDPSAKARGGDLGAFDRFTMTKPFADAAFGLDVGQLSGVVETEFGFHIIKRTE